jgi:hypothetical protein
MKIGLIIPDRGDRPEFLENCRRMMKWQTYNDIWIHIVDEKSKSDECDITARYKKGYDFFKNLGFDCILLIENDDWYSEDYIETMVKEWKKHGKPDIFGTGYTYYYHLGMLKVKKLDHPRRASAMNTLIKPDLNIIWPKDNDPYTDMHLWKQLKGVTFQPEQIISIGMKHNVGKTGGQYHSTKLERYQDNDKEMLFLKENLDTTSFNFYKSIHEKIRSSFG